MAGLARAGLSGPGKTHQHDLEFPALTEWLSQTLALGRALGDSSIDG